MSPTLMVILEFTITAGAAVVWGAREYWKIRPGKREPPPPSPEDPRHPEG